MQTGADNQLPLMLPISQILDSGRDFNGISLAAPDQERDDWSNKMLRVNGEATKHGQRANYNKRRRNKM